MSIINIRGTSGSGKSTLVHRYLAEHKHESLSTRLANWKSDKIVAYKCFPEINEALPEEKKWLNNAMTYVIGRYETQCGGCDALSYKGAHDDIQEMLEAAAAKGNAIFEGLTISSTYGRWLKTSAKFPGQFVWMFMNTPEEVCHQRILARNGGKEPKRDAKGLADYNRKYQGCITQAAKLEEMGERVVWVSSDDSGYQKLLELLNG